MHILALPALADNYIWLLHDTSRASVVDPGQAAPVVQALRSKGLALAAIVLTHWHSDHTAGVDEIFQSCADGHTLLYLPAQGADEAARSWPHVPARALRPCSDAATFSLPGAQRVRVLASPGHTPEHTSYYLQSEAADEPAVLLSGDALFSAGCGRLFGGTAQQMFETLRRFAALPAATRVCAAHEYTLANLRFACAAEPENPDVQACLRRCEALRAQQRPTLPSTVGEELAINPFLRAPTPEAFAALRAWKDRF